MASPAVTYTFTNSTTADATQVNQNFSDLIAGMTDGSKSFSIDALTVAGATLLNGTVGLGNASADDITFNGYVASAITPKTDDTYDLGTAALAWQDLYLDGALYSDTISELTGAAGVTIDGVLHKDSILTAAGGLDTGAVGTTVGLTLRNNVASYSPSVLNHHENGTFNAVFNTGMNTASTTVAVAYTRIGKNVTLTFSGATVTCTVANLFWNTSGTPIPARLRPNENVIVGCGIYDSAQVTAGLMFAYANGDMLVQKYNLGVFTSGAATCGFIGGSVCYTI